MQGREVGRWRCARLVALVVAALTLVPAFAQPSYASTSSSYFSILNQERASRGLAPLRFSADLVGVAQSWSDVMARSRVLRHNPRLESAVSNWWSVGENVGVGPDLNDIAQAFWNSSEHRANILDSHYTDVGIAAANSDGRIWITVVFRQPWHHVSVHVTHHVVPVQSPQPVAKPKEKKPAPPPVLMRVRWVARLWAWR